MPNFNFDFFKVINPVEPVQFFDQYWEKQPLIISREAPDYYAELLSLKDIDYIISTLGLRYPSVRLVKNGTQLPVSAYTTDLQWSADVFSQFVEADRVFAEYRQGATIILQALHRNWQPLALFCRNLEKYLNHPVQVNIYLTPKSSQGFNAHYDTHDVLVLQLAGSKQWRIYESALELPHRTQSFKSDQYCPGKLLHEINLGAGDMVYLPRGFMHEALTSDDISLHATVGILSYTWYEVLTEALNRCKEDVRFRKALPVGFVDNPGLSSEQISALLAAALERLDLEKATEAIGERFVTTRSPFLSGHLENLTNLDELALTTHLKPVSGVICRVKAEPDEKCSLVFHGKKIVFPDYVEPFLRFITQSGEKGFVVGAIPGNLDGQGKLVLARRLVQEGFLTIAGRS